MTRTTLPGSVICGVGLMALGTLFLEVVLTRIFAVTLWYHFGFLAISLALLGTAASAVLCFVQPRLASDEDHMRNMMRSALAFAVSVPITIVVHLGMSLPPPSAGLPFYAVFAFQLLLLFVTFALSGLCISIALFRYANQIGALYFFDLVGASLGSLLVVPLLFQRSAIALTFGVSAVGCLSAIAFQLGEKSESKRFTRFIVPSLLVGAIAFVLLACFNDQLGILKISRVKSYSAHRVQREEGEKVFEKWSPVSRVAVFAPSKRDGWETMLVTNDAGASTMLRRFDDRDFDRARRMVEEDARQIVHAVKRDASVLIIGSAGGTDVLTSLAMNQSRITAVEINPVIGELVTTLQANYIGHIFDDPRVTLHIQEGRNFAARSADQYDIIEISMIDSWAGAAAGAYVFNENSLYTYEAVRDYYQHLKPDGVLSVTRYLVWDESLRLTATYVKYLRDLGLDQIPERIVVVAEGDTHYRRATVLLKNGRFTAEEASTLAAVGEKAGGTLIWAPFVDPKRFMPEGQGVETYRQLIHSGSEQAFEAIVESYGANIEPSTDNTPFFFFTTRMSEVFEPRPSDHPARRLALPLLYGMLGFFLVVALLTIFLPLLFKAGKEIRQAPHALRSLGYFAMLGVGFMLFELSLIQRLTVFLGHPIWSFVVVLTTVLCASGIGSYLSRRFTKPQHLVNVLLAIVVVMSVYVLGVYDLLIDLMVLSKVSRMALAVGITALPGLLLGMCFPMGIRIAQQFHSALVPWGWGVNGACSVFASIFSIVIALNLGFKFSMSVGIACYAIALGIIWSLRGVTQGMTLANE